MRKFKICSRSDGGEAKSALETCFQQMDMIPLQQRFTHVEFYTMAQKILIIEDEDGIIHLLNLYLKDAGYEIVVAKDGADGLAMHAREHPDLVLLDIMLPALDGFEVCRRIRAWSKTPILMLTARGDENDRISGLDLGADDYLVKPFSPRELVSRVRAILRRINTQESAAEAHPLMG